MADAVEGQSQVRITQTISSWNMTLTLPLHLPRVLMQNLSDAQYDRFEAYRRHALPKQAVRKVLQLGVYPLLSISDLTSQVIQQTVGQQVSMPVAQVVAGISKVFVGEIVEKGQIHACVTVQSSVFFI
jgi:hypothetical protein